MKLATCFFKDHESSIDVILTNQPKKFKNSFSVELGISDCHKMIGTHLKSSLSFLKTRQMTYRSFKNLNINSFNTDLSNSLNDMSFLNTNDAFDNLIALLTKNLDKHAPLKHKMIRGNQSRFMNKDLAKAIMTRSRLKAKYQKSKSKNDRLNYTKQRNLCKKLRDEAIKSDFQKSFTDIKKNSKKFYHILKPYLSKKGSLSSSDIKLIESDDVISDGIKMANIFNQYYTNIVEYTSGKAPQSLADTLPSFTQIDVIIREIKKKFQHHPSICNIKNNSLNVSSFRFKLVTIPEVEFILKTLNTKKSIGIDGIPSIILKLSASVIAEPLTKIINSCITENTFPSLAKYATIIPVYKKYERTDKKNYRPISVLSALSKVFERIFHSQITNYMDNVLSQYVSAYRKNYSSQHVLIRL